MSVIVHSCHDCPFVHEVYDPNKYGGQTDIEECTLYMPPTTTHDEREALLRDMVLSDKDGPPSWCRLREAAVLAKLASKKKGRSAPSSR